MDYKQLAEELEHVFEASDKLCCKGFYAGADATLKEDGSPVTDYDKACEELWRLNLEQYNWPVLGEENGSGNVNDLGQTYWVVDPIDGTRQYAQGLPWSCTLVGLVDKGEVVFGALSFFCTGEHAWAGKNLGAHSNLRGSLETSERGVQNARFNAGNPLYLEKPAGAKLAKLFNYREQWPNGLGHYMVACGALDLSITDPDKKAGLWDTAALKIIVEEAGGTLNGLRHSKNLLEESFYSANRRMGELVEKILRPGQAVMHRD